MIILSPRHRSGQQHSSRVHRLPHFPQISPPSHFLNQHGSQPVCAQLFMNTQKINLDHVNLLVSDLHSHRYPRHEPHQLLTLAYPDPQVQLRSKPRRSQGSFQKGNAVIKSEHIVIVLYVVLCQQLVDLLHLIRIVEVNGCPLESRRQLVRLLFDFFYGLELNRLIHFFGDGLLDSF